MSLAWRLVRRPFARPLLTAHGRWEQRRSIILRLSDGAGRRGYGEMAPVPGFPGPDIDACELICRSLGTSVPVEALCSTTLPPCAGFAFGSALSMLGGRLPRAGRWPLARLLPAGPGALYELGRGIREGCRCFKYKLCGMPDRTEMEIVEMLLESLLAAKGRLRVDANGGLPEDRAGQCLEWLRDAGGRALDYVEQPLPPGREERMLALMLESGVCVALDESVGGMESLQRWLDWPGALVVKPALAGDPLELAALLKQRQGRTVYSSALESPVGLWGALLAVGHDDPEPLGFCHGLWQEDDAWAQFTKGTFIDSRLPGLCDLDALWEAL